MNALGDLERQVMDRLWADPAPQSVREVHQALSRDRELAYTTVMTVLDRLAKKGLVRRERDGRAYRYQAGQTRDELVAELMHSTLADELSDREDDRTAALVAFVGRVSPDEAAAMRAALDRLEGR
ncbi:putative transcriptional regulator [Friedmanniella endophytica]|uniref:Putative transcriptional regulator n=1 Tax=Microlunatus kandeliicorticis TaxID=1759536 RepID=A0A7W3IQK4_9ACTN|nr:BlaI/MecI/CopY family transcriptional regulator [Microlunatus kandeliicorticis]MBA8793385.1 putative transcriptional regulator [Microlunatus kandeliicorticis]